MLRNIVIGEVCLFDHIIRYTDGVVLKVCFNDYKKSFSFGHTIKTKNTSLSLVFHK